MTVTEARARAEDARVNGEAPGGAGTGAACSACGGAGVRRVPCPFCLHDFRSKRACPAGCRRGIAVVTCSGCGRGWGSGRRG
jgi:hypothetical protein